MQMSPNIGALATALSLAQGEMGAALKDASNPFFKSKYADLTSVMEAIKGPFHKNGLSFTQLPGMSGDKLVLTTMLLHKSGEWISSETPIIAAKPDAQSMGSAITYARRYALQSIAGVTADDDDGNAASGQKMTVKGEPAKVKSKWTPEQTAEFGAYGAELHQYGEDAVKRGQKIWYDMAYDPPSDAIDAIAKLVNSYK
jgi:hypothetical protein